MTPGKDKTNGRVWGGARSKKVESKRGRRFGGGSKRKPNVRWGGTSGGGKNKFPDLREATLGDNAALVWGTIHPALDSWRGGAGASDGGRKGHTTGVFIKKTKWKR